MHAVTAEEKRKLFETHGFFDQLSDGDLDILLSHARTEHHPAKHLIFAKGTPGRSMMAVLHGRVKISSPSDAGREIILAVLEAGEIFGEMALLDGSERTADATAMADCALLVIDQRDFLPFLERRFDLCIKLMRLLCRRLRQTNEHVEGVLFEKLDTRLAKALIRLSSPIGPGRASGRIRISQTELANMLGASREAVNKQLHVWERAGFLVINKQEIVIPDITDIEQWAMP